MNTQSPHLLVPVHTGPGIPVGAAIVPPHGIITGATGKTCALLAFATDLANRYSFDELQLLVISPSGGLGFLSRNPRIDGMYGAYAQTLWGPDVSTISTGAFTDEVIQRLTAIHHEHTTSDVLHHRAILIDDLGDWGLGDDAFGTDGDADRLLTALQQLIADGPSNGVHIIIALHDQETRAAQRLLSTHGGFRLSGAPDPTATAPRAMTLRPCGAEIAQQVQITDVTDLIPSPVG
ncbi:hypothetical protein [Mycobacterium hubeiense]|uniref:hypothetical protein n=1 Tax=Mycobacterium hubeiense TaxID=1867256 RepID=UPI000C7EF3A7|nr:hypothetical protein [Mycobacterium sp. QGD 101]